MHRDESTQQRTGNAWRACCFFILLFFCFNLISESALVYLPSAVQAQATVEPQIMSITPGVARLSGGSEIIIRGQNFSANTRVFIGSSQIGSVTIESASVMRVVVPQQVAPGSRTITVINDNGMAQKQFWIVAKSVSELKPGEVTTMVGGTAPVGDGELATQTNLDYLSEMALDAEGNLYIADPFKHRIRRVDAKTGVITTIAGSGQRGLSGNNILALSADLEFPERPAVDPAGNVYFVEELANRVRKIDMQTGLITTVAGNGSEIIGNDGVLAINSGMKPRALAFDKAGNLYIKGGGLDPSVAEFPGIAIMRVDAKTGMLTVIAGKGSAMNDGADALSTKLNLTIGLAIDDNNNIFYADGDRLRKIDGKTNKVTTVAGILGNRRFNGDGTIQNTALTAIDVAIEQNGNLLIADSDNNCIRRVDLQRGTVKVVAGKAFDLYLNDNYTYELFSDFYNTPDNVNALEARLIYPAGVKVDKAGNIFLHANTRIRRVDAGNGKITTVAGGKEQLLSGNDGPAAQASLNFPTSVAYDRNGNLYIADRNNNNVRKVDAATGNISILAGNGAFGFSGDGGPAVNASFALPTDVTTDPKGNVYIYDSFNNRIRKVDAVTGIITTFAGTGVPGFNGDGGPAQNAKIYVERMAFDSNGNMFFTDPASQRVRRIDSRGVISTYAGNGCDNQEPYTGCDLGDGGPATNATLISPFGLAIDKDNNVYVADFVDYRVRKIDAKTSVITTVAGKGNNSNQVSTGDGGPATKADVHPFNIAVDSQNNIFVTELYPNDRIRRIDAATGIIETVGGGTAGYLGDNSPASAARFFFGYGDLTVDANDNLVIADFGNSAVRSIKKLDSQIVRMTISNVKYKDGNLIISGKNLAGGEATIMINNGDVSNMVDSRTDRQINLTGTKKALYLKSGQNTLTIIMDGKTTTFSFNL